MTMEEALTHARQALSVTAAENEIADLAATLYVRAATPDERARLAMDEACREAFEVMLEHATDFTDEQLRAMELTEEQSRRMAAARRGVV
jgi:hypothetical protein